ncbi:hypothetical protein N0V90_012112 [Kalmusia sp. IMI 367209]|nr:hypothetical protein N0V90_012112 [Kalmusia sp. IMI 367209]
MRLSSVFLAAASLAVGVQAQDPPFSEQLLKTLDAFSSSDPIISSLVATIESNSEVLDNTINLSNRSLLAPADRSRLACKLLSCVFSTGYSDSSSTSTYNVLKTKNWSANCDLPAACFVTPDHPAKVAVALQIITLTQSKFAVRSGGHNPNIGFSSVGAEGVTIDTQSFTALSLNADKSLATVGAGLRFGAVQSYLDQQGVAVVSGRNKDVGVGGLLLGGGHPIINSLTGLAADNIDSATVVTSDFRVVKASASSNPDLFKALKGGVNNFGVVTEYVLKTKQPRNIWYRIAAYPTTNPKAFFEALVAVQKNMESDPKAGIAVTASPAAFAVSFVYGAYTGDPAVFAPFKSLTPTAESTPPTNGTTLGFITLQSPPQPENFSRDTVGVTTYLDADLYTEIYNQYLTAASTYNSATTTLLMPIQTFGSGSAKVAAANGGNVMGQSAKAQTWWNPIAQWSNTPADDSKVHTALINLAHSIQSSAQAKGLYDKYIFANIASKDQQVLNSYGQANLDFMKTVSKKYDPLQTFQKLQNGGFLVTKA